MTAAEAKQTVEEYEKWLFENEETLSPEAKHLANQLLHSLAQRHGKIQLAEARDAAGQ